MNSEPITNVSLQPNNTSPTNRRLPNLLVKKQSRIKKEIIPVNEEIRHATGDIVIHPVDGCRKLICNMTLLVNNKTKEVFVIDSGKGLEEISPNIPVITKAVLDRATTRKPNFKILVDYYRRGYKIIGFMVTHIHADHIGSFNDCKNYLENAGIKLDFKIYGSKITHVLGSVLSKCSYYKNNFQILEDRQLKIINEHFKFYPIQVNHSAPETMGAFFKTGDKTILYIPDCKIDFDPVIGVNEEELQNYYKKINSTTPDAVIIESTNIGQADKPIVTEGEVAASLKKLILYHNEQKDTIIVTTFATNAARLLSIIRAAVAAKRTVGVYGRSMCNAINAYLEVGLIPAHFKESIVLLDNFNPVNKDKKRFVVLCTGHQGEPSAALPRMVADQLGYRWSKKDLVIFSSSQIPAVNAEISRSILMCELKQRRLEIIDKVHCSGHITKRDAIRIVSNVSNCKKFIINHGDFDQMVHYYDILHNLDISEDRLILGRNNWSYSV